MLQKYSGTKFCFFISLIVLFISVSAAFSQTSQEYHDRVNRWEGTKPKAIGAYDIELISVLVDFKEDINGMPNRLKVKFYLPRLSEVYLTVRELDYKHYYWLDKVIPSKPWGIGFGNVFEWLNAQALTKR